MSSSRSSVTASAAANLVCVLSSETESTRQSMNPSTTAWRTSVTRAIRYLREKGSIRSGPPFWIGLVVFPALF